MKTNPLTPIPHRPDDEPIVCIPINRYWLAALSAMIYPFRYPEAWTGTLEENQQARTDVLQILFLLMEMEDCANMAGCCDDTISPNKTYRIAADGWNVEVSNDGGETWKAAPDDPRRYFPVPLPRIPTGVPDVDKCISANNEVEALQAAVDQYASTTGTVFQVLITVLLTLIGIGLTTTGIGAILAPLAYTIAVAVSKLGEEAYKAIFTEEAWAATRCALYCVLEDDGSLSAAKFNEFLGNINAMVPGDTSINSPRTQILDMVKTQGYALTALNTTFGTGNAEGCDDCDCAETCDLDNWQFIDGEHGTNRVEGTDQYGHYLQADASLQSNGNYYIIFRTPDISTCCWWSLTRIVSGTLGGARFQIACDVPYADENYVNYGVAGEHCVHTIQAQTSGPFTARFYLASCPVV